MCNCMGHSSGNGKKNSCCGGCSCGNKANSVDKNITSGGCRCGKGASCCRNNNVNSHKSV